MGVISRLYNFTAGSVIYSAQVNAEFDQILGLVNGSIDQNNINPAATPTVASLAVSGAASAITHSATTHRKSFLAFLANLSGFDNPLTKAAGDYYLCPGATDNDYDYAGFNLDVPNGAVLTKIYISGSTGASYGVVAASIYRVDSSLGVLSLGSVSFAAGATSGSTNITPVVVDSSTYGYELRIYAKVAAGGAVTDAKIYRVYIEYTTVNVGQL